MEHLEDKNYQSEGQLENEKSNYTNLSTEGPEGEPAPEDESDLQDTATEEDDDDISGDLAGNASGNEDAEDE